MAPTFAERKATMAQFRGAKGNYNANFRGAKGNYTALRRVWNL